MLQWIIVLNVMMTQKVYMILSDCNLIFLTITAQVVPNVYKCVCSDERIERHLEESL